MMRILVVLPEGFEEVEALTPVDLWRRAGLDVTVAALSGSIHVTGRSGITVHADVPLDAALQSPPHDVVFLPGGPGVRQLRADGRVRQLVQAHARDGRWLWAICAAPTVLHDAGLLQGRRYTAHFSVQTELTELHADEPVVVDGNIMTSRGAGTALPFALEGIRLLLGAGKADEVAASICA